jgi:hypothetical protein
VEQVHPLVLGELAGEHLVVPHLLERDAGVGERERHRVVPRLRAGRRVDRHLGCLLERHRVHVAARHVAAHGGGAVPAERLHGDAGERGAAPQLREVGEEVRPAAVVEQPLALLPVLERVVDEPVGAQVVALRVVHRHEQRLRAGRAGGGGREQRRQQHAGAAGGTPRGRRERVRVHGPNGASYVPAPSASSSRRAIGTRALSG